jgi:hypothetical protein
MQIHRVISVQNQLLQATRNLLILISASIQFSSASALDLYSAEKKQPCTVDTSDISEPLISDDLQILMTRYAFASMCDGRLSSALETIFTREKRDETWAGPLEERFSALAAVATEVKIRGECRASLCRYDIEQSHPDKHIDIQHEIDDKVIASVKSTKLTVESVRFAKPSGYIAYFYSTVLPAEFVEPLRRAMEDKRTPPRT